MFPTSGHQVRPPATSVPSFVSLQLWRFLTPNVSSPQHLAAEDRNQKPVWGWVMFFFVGVEILQNVFNIVKSLRSFQCVVFFSPLEEDKGKVTSTEKKKATRRRMPKLIFTFKKKLRKNGLIHLFLQKPQSNDLWGKKQNCPSPWILVARLSHAQIHQEFFKAKNCPERFCRDFPSGDVGIIYWLIDWKRLENTFPLINRFHGEMILSTGIAYQYF